MDNIDKHLDINKETKYREEIFQLLESVLKDTNGNENQLFKELFVGEPLDNNQLLKLISSLK